MTKIKATITRADFLAIEGIKGQPKIDLLSVTNRAGEEFEVELAVYRDEDKKQMKLTEFSHLVFDNKGMKTYETMKHNIPEGATHYIDESDDFGFAWFDLDVGAIFILDYWVRCDIGDYPKDEVKKIPTEPKYSYEKVEFKSDIERANAFIDGDLFVFTHGEVVGDLEKDTHPVISLDQMVCGNAIYRRIELTKRDLWIQSAKEAVDGLPIGSNEDAVLGAIFDKLVDGE